MNRRSQVLAAMAGMAMTVAFAVGALAQDDFAADAARLTNALKLRAGQTVADIGAGEGQLTLALARAVGPSGRVYATEVNGRLLPVIRRAAAAAALENVTVIEAHATRTNLADDCCDALVVRNVYHHFSDPGLMNRSMRQSLRPGGLLAIIDFAPDGAETANPAGRGSGDRHGVTIATVVRELRDAGFEEVAVEEGTRKRSFMVVVRRPMGAPPPPHQPPEAVQEVVAAVEQLFSSMRTRDTTALRAQLDSALVIVAHTTAADGTPRMSRRTVSDFLRAVATSAAELRERMWAPEVRVDGALATLWAPYDFHVGERFSHCGHDAVHLARRNGRWVITGLAYTVQQTGCSPAPVAR